MDVIEHDCADMPFAASITCERPADGWELCFTTGTSGSKYAVGASVDVTLFNVRACPWCGARLDAPEEGGKRCS